MIRREYSILLDSVSDTTQQTCILKDEARWHYSVHFHAESKGEEVIENLLALAGAKKQRALLGAQLHDEAEHTSLFKQITDKIGLDTRASLYANSYSELVMSQKSLAEKVFVFQIITEAASAAYCEWRLEAMQESPFACHDIAVRDDEKRHLLMGHSMLRICDPDEIQEKLPRARRIELLKAMNQVCRSVGHHEIHSALIGGEPRIAKPSTLDKMITRSVLLESRAVDRLLDSQSHFQKASV